MQFGQPKNRQELIDYSIEKNLYDSIREELIELGCPVRIINGMPDHVLLVIETTGYI